MLTLILAVAAACGVFAAVHFAADVGIGWSVFFGVLGFGVFQGVAGYLIQKRVKALMAEVQKILLNGQKALQQKTQKWQIRPPGSVQEAQRIMMADMKVFVGAAIAKAEEMRRFRLWVPMIEKQIATAKFQLSWMIKDFKTVDALMPKAIFLDPTMMAMKMARLYMTGGDMKEIRKAYEKGVRRVRYNGNVLLAATMSWIEVQKGEVDAAFKTLTEALKSSDNATLKQNHENLMNNRVAHFNNSGLGDTWYALHLEQPKIRVQRQRSAFR